MRHVIKALCLLVGCLAAGAASAALTQRGPLMVYDDVLNVTWLRDFNYAKTSGYDADGLMSWDAANAWAASLRVGGFDDWRLPTFDPSNPRPPILTSTNEFGSLWMQLQQGGTIGTYTDISPFYNLPLQNEPWNSKTEWYWTGLADSSDPTSAWRISMQCACWDSPLKVVEFHVMAVRDGDVGANRSAKTEICHATGTGAYWPISINAAAVAAHVAHGDAFPGDMIGDKILANDCTLQ